MTPRVCVVAPLYHPSLGGLGRQSQQLTESLRRRGVELFVVSRRLASAPPAQFAPDVEVVRLPAPRPERHVLEERSLPNLLTSLVFSGRLAVTLWRRRADYELAHFHGASLPLFVSLPVLRRARKRVIAKVAAAGLRTEMGDLRGRYLGLGSALVRLGRRVDRYIAISEEIRRGLLSDGIPAERIVRLDNFVDLRIFRPLDAAERARLRAEKALEGCFVVLAAGRLVRRKGVSTLLEAFAAVVARAPQARLLILGDGPDRNELEQVAHRLLPAGAACFAGEVGDPERYLQMADLFVLPSLREGMPNALLEAMATGLPAVANAIGGVEDLSRAGGGIVQTRPGDARELAESIVRLISDDPERTRLANASLFAMRSGFSLEDRTAQYLDLYRDLAGRNSP